MTQDEAARVLTRLMDKSNDLWANWQEEHLDMTVWGALHAAIAALRGPEPDPATGLMKCDFCTDTFDQKPLFQENKYKPYTRMVSTISIEEYNGKHQIEIDLWDGANVYAAFEINYCPMCGRKLEVEG